MGLVDYKITSTAVKPLFETLISCLSDGVLIADETGLVLCQNEASKKMLGAYHDTPLAKNTPVGQTTLNTLFDLAPTPTTWAAGAPTAGATPTAGTTPAAGATPATGAMLDNFVRVSETVNTGGAARDLDLYLGTITMPEDDRHLNVVISQDRTPAKGPASVPELETQGFITNDREMMAIMSRLKQIAKSSATVLLMGESGTGKTQIARLVHDHSPRANKELVEVNCAAIPEQLLESELFGHVKGAFTGATQKRKGRFQAAHGGTLLLDEIGEIPLHLQAKLLRAIQDQCFEPVGSDKTVKVDVRVVSATNQDLRDMVNAGKFRADLFYRLAVMQIKIPPLRERVGDIPLLLKHFCTDLTARGYPNDVACTSEAMRMMMDYPWPGNVREMINAVEHAYICAVDKAVVPESLPQDIRHHSLDPALAPRPDAPPSDAPPPNDAQDHDRERIRKALSTARGNKSAAARTLSIDRTTLWRRMRKYGLT